MLHASVTLTGRQGPNLEVAPRPSCRPQHFRHADPARPLHHLAGARPAATAAISAPIGRNLRRIFSRFWKCYVGRRGYREGPYGFLIALCAALYPILSYLKARLESGLMATVVMADDGDRLRRRDGRARAARRRRNRLRGARRSLGAARPSGRGAQPLPSSRCATTGCTGRRCRAEFRRPAISTSAIAAHRVIGLVRSPSAGCSGCTIPPAI